jgi:hypothetical protein
MKSVFIIPCNLHTDVAYASRNLATAAPSTALDSAFGAVFSRKRSTDDSSPASDFWFQRGWKGTLLRCLYSTDWLRRLGLC